MPSRRRFLTGLTAGSLAMLVDPMSLFSPVHARRAEWIQNAAAESLTGKKLVLVYADGGIRSADFCDTYPGFTNSELICGYRNSDIIQSASGSGTNMPLPPTAKGFMGERTHFVRSNSAGVVQYLLESGKKDWSENLSLVYSVACESAAHIPAKKFALTGYNRNDRPGVPVILGDGATTTINALSMGIPLSPGRLQPTLLGEPDDLALLFSRNGAGSGSLGGNGGLGLLVDVAVANRDRHFRRSVQYDSRYHEWKARDAEASAMLNAGIQSIFETSGEIEAYTKPFATTSIDYRDEYIAKRFVAARKVLTGGYSNAVTIGIRGFDTHNESQQPYCSQLAVMLGIFMDQLGALMDDTIVIVMSDFDRTAITNSSNGTDHHPVTTVPLFSGNNIAITPGPYGASTTAQLDKGTVYRRDIWLSVLRALDVPQPEKFFRDANYLF